MCLDYVILPTHFSIQIFLYGFPIDNRRHYIYHEISIEQPSVGLASLAQSFNPTADEHICKTRERERERERCGVRKHKEKGTELYSCMICIKL